MNAIRHFWRLKGDVVKRCMANEAFLEDVLNGDEEGVVEVFDVDKAWDAIHFLISANRAYPDQAEEENDIRFDHAILGTKIHKGLSVGYGGPGVVPVEEVRQISAQFEDLGEEELKDRFDPEAMDTAEVYPEIWKQEAAEAWEYLFDHYTRLKEFYKRAASDGHGVATWVIPPRAAE